MVTVGLLYPGHSAEDDFPALEARLGGAVRLPVVITSVGEDAHRVDALLDLGRPSGWPTAPRSWPAEKPDAVMWACTSGSFVFGREGAHDQASVSRPSPVSRRRRRRSRSSMRCGTSVCAGSRSRRPTPTTWRSISSGFLHAAASRWWRWAATGSSPRPRSARSTPEQVVAMVAAADHPDAEAVLVPDTAMHTLAIVDELEAAVGKPVLTANQVTVWKGLRAARPGTRPAGVGQLLFGDQAMTSLHRAARAGVDAEHHRRQAAPGDRPRRAQARRAARRGRAGPQARRQPRPAARGHAAAHPGRAAGLDPQPWPVRHRHDARRGPRHVPGARGDRTRRRRARSSTATTSRRATSCSAIVGQMADGDARRPRSASSTSPSTNACVRAGRQPAADPDAPDLHHRDPDVHPRARGVLLRRGGPRRGAPRHGRTRSAPATANSPTNCLSRTWTTPSTD